jgi:hypothetical protein
MAVLTKNDFSSLKKKKKCVYLKTRCLREILEHVRITYHCISRVMRQKMTITVLVNVRLVVKYAASPAYTIHTGAVELPYIRYKDNKRMIPAATRIMFV